MPSFGPAVLIQHDKEQQKEIENRKRKGFFVLNQFFDIFSNQVEELEKSQKTLDELFKKTKTLPSIYFMPLSEEEVS